MYLSPQSLGGSLPQPLIFKGPQILDFLLAQLFSLSFIFKSGSGDPHDLLTSERRPGPAQVSPLGNGWPQGVLGPRAHAESPQVSLPQQTPVRAARPGHMLRSLGFGLL